MKKYTSKSSTTNGILWGILAIGVVTLALVAIQMFNSSNDSTDVRVRASVQSTGNGAPNGTHYNLNIHGVPKTKTADMTGSDTHSIFVPEYGNCKINLFQGEFQVLDGNCTDGSAAFQLPSPDPLNTGVTSYSVWARALGKPGGSSKTTTCADLVTTDPTTGQTTTQTYCSVYTLTLDRTKGKSSFGNVSSYLLYIYADLNGDGVLERYPLFDPALQDYYWNYENNGLKLVQLRFYPLPTTVPAP